jgi:Family of unknown function (DUF5681)
MPRHATITSFRSGQSGNPRGRSPGTRNRATLEARAAAQDLLSDPVYIASLRQRLIDGTAGAMEALCWLYAFGKPSEQAEQNESSALAALSNDELKARLVEAMAKL